MAYTTFARSLRIDREVFFDHLYGFCFVTLSVSLELLVLEIIFLSEFVLFQLNIANFGR